MNEIQPLSFREIGPSSACLNGICSPWTCEGSTLEKVAAWAGFFFCGWIYYPISAMSHAVTQIYAWCLGKNQINRVVNRILRTDPLAQGLANFNNPRVAGQINGIYITTNETHLETTRQFFQEHPREDRAAPTLHIGCATWHNLDIICARRSTYGLIVDFNPKNADFIEKTIEIIRESASRETFIQSMVAYLNALEGTERQLFFHRDQQGLPTERVEAELVREGSWLHSEENYLYIKQELVARDRLVAITEDITHDEQWVSIRRFLNENNVVIDTLYLSNICQFMQTTHQKQSFLRSLRQLLQPDTLMINCPKIRQPNAPATNTLEQRPTLGREVLANTYPVFEQIVGENN